MVEEINIGDFSVTVTRKKIKNLHLAVQPPDGAVTVSAPHDLSLEVIRSFTIMKLGWISKQRAAFAGQLREGPRLAVTRESHDIFGCHYLLDVEEKKGRPGIAINGNRIIMRVRPGTSQENRLRLLHQWQRGLLHDYLPAVINKWEQAIAVSSSGYSLRRMKTKWGSCNPASRHLLFNTELVKKPRHLIEYVVIHELLHLVEPSHNDAFVALMDKYCQHWREAKAELNALPLEILEKM